MAIELRVPAIGESITEVRVEKWLKAEGARADRDETVCVLETEKSSIDLPAPASGRITKILKQAGETAKIDDILAYMEELPADEPRSAAPAAVPAAPQKTPESPAPPAPRPAQPHGERQEEVVPMTPIRKRIAERLIAVHQTMAPVTTFNEIDMSALAKLRQEHQAAFQEKHQIKLGMMSCFVKACVEALKQFPQLNAQIRDEQIVYHNYHDIAIAIGGGKGLVAPVLRNAELMGFADIEKAVQDFAVRAKVNKLEPDELRGGTFTITNGGVFGSLLSTPIINPPQSGILGMHAIQDRPVAVNGQVVIRPMMYVALTYDHRLVDGREAVTFLKAIKQYVENPLRILLEL